jgi:signal transduction histidine kinase
LNGVYKYYWGYYSKAGPLHPLFLLIYFIIYARAIYLLCNAYGNRKNALSGHKLSQIKYLIAAFIAAVTGGIDYIPKYGVEIYPFGFIFVLGFCAIVAYAIISHQLLDIAVVIKKTVVFAGLFTFVYMVFAIMAYIGQDILRNLIGVNYWIAIVPSILIMIAALKPIETFLVNITDKYLFQKKYDYKELLKTFTMSVLSVLDANELLEIAVTNFKEIMKLRSAALYLLEKDGHKIRAYRGAGLSIKAKEITVPEKIAAGSPELIIPLVLRDRTVAILMLGRKMSDESYTKDDLGILLPIAKTLAIAISNAEMFEELKVIQAEASQKEKMAMIGTLAAGMAHEIRNPIMTIRTFADYLPERFSDADFVKKFNRIIPGEIEKVDNIAYSLLEFSGVEEKAETEVVDLRDAMKIVVSLLEPQYKFSGITISIPDKHACAITARVNKKDMQSSFFNILKYVISEAPKGEEVLVEMSRESDKSVSVSIKAKNIAVAEHVIKDVFEPMSRLYKEKRGFGFNLFIAKQLLERNGGHFTIRSDREEGSEFKVSFKSTSV